MDAVDLLGFPLPPSAVSRPRFSVFQTIQDVLERREARKEAGEARLKKFLEQSPTGLLFENLFEVLNRKLVDVHLPRGYDSDLGTVAPAEDEVPEAQDDVEIPYVAWGEPMVIDANGLQWSHEGLVYTQTKLLWRSFEELMLEYNPRDKWDALKWIFAPMVWKDYVWDKKAGRSICVETHQRTQPFSFHNCCIAARMDPDALRDGVRRNLPEDVLTAVMKVCTFD